MLSKGLLIHLETHHDKDDDAKKFLKKILPERGTHTFFTVRFEKYRYALFSLYESNEKRDAYIASKEYETLKRQTGILFTVMPVIQKVNILSEKLPEKISVLPDKKGLLLTFKAKEKNKEKIEQFLRDPNRFTDDESEASSCFTIDLGAGEYGVFDVSPESPNRVKHIFGRMPWELVKQSISALGTISGIGTVNLLNETLNEMSVY